MRFDISATVIALAVLAAAPAPGQRPGTVELGAFGRYSRFDRSLGWDNTFGAGGRLGVFIAPGLALEASAAYVSVNGPHNKPIQLVPINARLLYVVPLANQLGLLLGAGYVRNNYTNTIGSWEDGASALLGLRFGVANRVALRLEAIEDLFTSPFNQGPGASNNWNATVQAGLSVLFGRNGPKDGDHDGVADELDACRNTPPGDLVDDHGCSVPSDADSDGVVDAVDLCLNTPPGDKVDLNGCSLPKDADRDGVSDATDRCPNTPLGERVNAEGCALDSDGDGVVDAIDQCANTPVGTVVDAKGCALPKDSDGDGVMDPTDKCPGTSLGERVDAIGCPVLFPERERRIVLEGVNFETASANLTDQSYVTLNRVAASLSAHSDLQVEVAGYTDSRGSDLYNQRLSQSRADAVRGYLIRRGVAPAQLTARGFGETNAIDTNATANGQGRNRRVELHRTN
jgi:outer membrane protein OmpA-like peptidoglycan-associated protein